MWGKPGVLNRSHQPRITRQKPGNQGNVGTRITTNEAKGEKDLNHGEQGEHGGGQWPLTGQKNFLFTAKAQSLPSTPIGGTQRETEEEAGARDP